jgi:hypothetical protein
MRVELLVRKFRASEESFCHHYCDERSLMTLDDTLRIYEVTPSFFQESFGPVVARCGDFRPEIAAMLGIDVANDASFGLQAAALSAGIPNKVTTAFGAELASTDRAPSVTVDAQGIDFPDAYQPGFGGAPVTVSDKPAPTQAAARPASQPASPRARAPGLTC